MKHKETEFDGRKALIVGNDHPHKGAICICKGADLTNIGWGMKFYNPNSDEEFYVFNGIDVKWSHD